MAIVAQMNQAIEAAAKDAAKKAARKLTPVLRNQAVAAGWPSDIVLNLTVESVNGVLYIDYPDADAQRVDDLEYGALGSSPTAVIRPFMARYASHLEEIMSNAIVDVINEMGVFS